MEISIKTQWSDLTLGDFIRVQEVAKNESGDEFEDAIKVLTILSNLSEEDIKLLPHQEFANLVSKLDFLNTTPIPNKVKKHYKIGDTEYALKLDLTGITTAQFIDYQSYMKLKPRPGFETFLTLWVIPKGHQYNDGYDMEELKSNLLQMDLLDALSIPVFIIKQLTGLLMISTDSLQSNLKKMGMSPKRVLEVITPLEDMAYGLWSSVCVKQPLRESTGFWSGLLLKPCILRALRSMSNALKRNK